MRRKFLLSAISGAGLAGAGLYFAPRMPDVMYAETAPDAVTSMLKMAQITGKDMVYDLGCGDGRFIIEAARQFGARGVGIDIDGKLIKGARELAQRSGVADRVRFIEADLFTADISEATIVTMYLGPQVNLKLRPKLHAELKPGTRVVSYRFDMGDWKPEKTEKSGPASIYLWRIPTRT